MIVYPAGYEQGKRYPLLLNVHGGPMGLFTETFVAAPGLYPIATFSARGYAVITAPEAIPTATRDKLALLIGRLGK